MALPDKWMKEPQGNLSDAFTGEDFFAKSRNHYEVNDGVPVAPAVDLPRPTVRQRIENLLNRGVDPLAHYVGHEGIDMDVPDDPDAPLTVSEQNYLDVVAAELAEQAPLPDEGLPRVSTSEVPSPAGPPGGGPPAGTPLSGAAAAADKPPQAQSQIAPKG